MGFQTVSQPREAASRCMAAARSTGPTAPSPGRYLCRQRSTTAPAARSCTCRLAARSWTSCSAVRLLAAHGGSIAAARRLHRPTHRRACPFALRALGCVQAAWRRAPSRSFLGSSALARRSCATPSASHASCQWTRAARRARRCTSTRRARFGPPAWSRSRRGTACRVSSGGNRRARPARAHTRRAAAAQTATFCCTAPPPCLRVALFSRLQLRTCSTT